MFVNEAVKPPENGKTIYVSRTDCATEDRKGVEGPAIVKQVIPVTKRGHIVDHRVLVEGSAILFRWNSLSRRQRSLFERFRADDRLPRGLVAFGEGAGLSA